MTATISALARTLLNPLIVLVSVPISVPWTVIGGALAFFGGVGLIFFTLSWLFAGTAPSFSIWDDYWLVPYFLGVLGILVTLQLLHLLWGRARLQGPLKVVLDICRYLAEPD